MVYAIAVIALLANAGQLFGVCLSTSSASALGV